MLRKLFALACLCALTSIGTVAFVGAATADPAEHVTICHRTGSATNPYVQISPSAAGVYNGHLDHEQTGNGLGGDIIPPFEYQGQTYSKNWPSGQVIFDNGCEVPETSPSPSPSPHASWRSPDADSDCIRATGHVLIRAYLTNTGDVTLHVTVTDIDFSGKFVSADVAPGESHEFDIDAGPSPLPSGQVRFEVTWDGGSETFYRTHSATSQCGPSPTPTTPPPTSPPPTTPPPTTPPPTTPPPTTPPTTPPHTHTPHTPAPRCEGHGSQRPRCNVPPVTTTPPSGLAFTGSSSRTPLLIALAIALLLGGSAFTWIGYRRQHS